jgi:hypothetical protein
MGLFDGLALLCLAGEWTTTFLWHVMIAGNNFTLICNGIDEDLRQYSFSFTMFPSLFFFITCILYSVRLLADKSRNTSAEIHTMNFGLITQQCTSRNLRFSDEIQELSKGKTRTYVRARHASRET